MRAPFLPSGSFAYLYNNFLARLQHFGNQLPGGGATRASGARAAAHLVRDFARRGGVPPLPRCAAGLRAAWAAESAARGCSENACALVGGGASPGSESLRGRIEFFVNFSVNPGVFPGVFSPVLFSVSFFVFC